MEKLSYCTTCIVILNLLVCVYCQKSVGDYCTVSGVIGQCAIITNCPRAIKDLGQKIAPTICEFEGAQIIVCCLGGTVNVTLTTTPPPIAGRIIASVPTMMRNPTIRSVGDKSRSKCKEYAKYVYEYVVAGAPPTADCAIVQRPLVVGGEDAKSKEFPHMALIGFKGENNVKEWKCGGSLISEQFVLTASHCLKAPPPLMGEPKYVRLGELVLRSDNDDADTQDFNINQIIRHPEYSAPSRYNDIALLKLDRKARLSTYVRPACLETSPRLDFMREPIATGWGYLNMMGPTSDALQKVTLQYFTYSKCNKTYRSDIGIRLRRGIVNETQICAGSHRDSKDTCQGDSGGPLQIVHEEEFCMYKIVGITSFGKGCGFIGIPAVYTRVSSYIQWIEETVWL